MISNRQQNLSFYEIFPQVKDILDGFVTQNKQNNILFQKYLTKSLFKKLDKMFQEEIHPYWQEQKKRHTGHVNRHTIYVLFCMYNNDSFKKLDEELQNISLWSALLHDIVKRGIPEINSYKDTFHPFLSASTILDYFEKKGFFNTEELLIKQKLQNILLQSKYLKSFNGLKKELICYKSLNQILDLSQQLLKTKFSITVFKVTAFHQSLSVLEKYPNYSILPSQIIYNIFDENQLRIYKLFMISDSKSYGKDIKTQKALEAEIRQSFIKFDQKNHKEKFNQVITYNIKNSNIYKNQLL